MKKGERIIVEITDMEFPNKAYGFYEGKKVYPSGNFIIGHKLRGTVTKIRNNKVELKKIEVIEKGKNEIEAQCPHFNICGGCTFQNLGYEDQVILKARLVYEVLKRNIGYDFDFEEVIRSPKQFEYRNKMEFSFGNERIDGPLTLGMHKKGSFHDVITVSECKLMDNDFRKILTMTADYFGEEERKGSLTFYHRLKHEGYLRNMVIRKGEKTGEIAVNLITTSQKDINLSGWKKNLLELPLNNRISGIVHTINNSLSDSVQAEKSEREEILYGKRDINEKIFNLDFRISPYSFFQTNSEGIELLYGKVMEYIDEINIMERRPVIFDLFSGTGTIGQIIAGKAEKVYGIELIEEAVGKARETAKLNNIGNIEFIAGDVFEKLDELDAKEIRPDIIILDPPRPGIGEKTIMKLLKYQVEHIIYVSCNPKTMAQDLVTFGNNGYRIVKAAPVDMFPQTPHVECIALIQREKS